MVVAAEPQAPEAVGGAGRARDKVLAAVVLVGVGAHDEDLGVLLGVGLGDDLLGAAVEDGLGGLLGEEDAGPEAVDGVGRARDEVLAAVVLIGVDTHDQRLGSCPWRGPRRQPSWHRRR